MNRTAKLTVPADIKFLKIVSQFVVHMAKLARIRQVDIQQIELAVDEVCTNVIFHSYHQDSNQNYSVYCHLDGQSISLEVEDNGESFDFDNVTIPNIDVPLEDRNIGGLGIYIIRNIMDEVKYNRISKNLNRLTMKKYISH